MRFLADCVVPLYQIYSYTTPLHREDRINPSETINLQYPNMIIEFKHR